MKNVKETPQLAPITYVNGKPTREFGVIVKPVMAIENGKSVRQLKPFKVSRQWNGRKWKELVKPLN